MAELKALLHGLALAKELGLNRVEIEGDSMIVINAARTGAISNWRLQASLEIILNLISKFESTTANHIFCEGNFKVDELESLAASGTYIKSIASDDQPILT